MKFEEFEKKIIPSCRTKHLHITNLLYFAKRLFKGKNLANTSNKIPFYLGPATIPPEFIRLEPWEMEYLFMLASYCKIGILETGRFNGGSALVMACANSAAPIYSIDIKPQDDTRLKNILNSIGVGENIQLITGDSQKTKYAAIGKIDMLFVDGDHSFNGCLSDLENWYENIVTGGHIVLHDSYFGCEVQSAIIEFMKSHNVEAIVSPYKIRNHFKHPEGSLCHLIKCE
jgi:predicted O-methyltransferase YrrM